jgi:hypothetical protein
VASVRNHLHTGAHLLPQQVSHPVPATFIRKENTIKNCGVQRADENEKEKRRIVTKRKLLIKYITSSRLELAVLKKSI